MTAKTWNTRMLGRGTCSGPPLRRHDNGLQLHVRISGQPLQETRNGEPLHETMKRGTHACLAEE